MVQAAPQGTGDVTLDERRQRAVAALGVSEGGPQERFDRIARLAHTVFAVPMAGITVLDGDRAWFPGAHGFARRSVPRSETLCQRVLAEVTEDGSGAVVSEDTRGDARFAGVPMVDDGTVGFYAGHPLRDRSGTVVGFFCLYDEQPRTLTEEQLTALGDLAAWAERELVSAEEMARAGAVQASMLPPGSLQVDGWEVAGMCRPAQAVGGDFFDYGVSQEVLHVGLGDVMGKGTSAALLGAGARAAIRGTHPAVTAGADLGVTVTHVARALAADLERTGSFVTLFEAAVELDEGLVRFVDAGMGLALLRQPDGRVERLRGSDRPLGVLPDDHWSEHTVPMAAGSRLLVFSDGVLDLLEDPDDWDGPLGRLLGEHDSVPALLAAVGRLCEERLALDDVTVVAVYRSDA